ncbi:MAG: polyphosphate polymerase domain-containing protein [Microbacterium sp.]
MTALDYDRFAAIGLEQLIAEAALQTRVDRKYVLPRSDAAQVVGALDSGIRILDTAGTRAFRYESVYFDTPDLLSFRLAARPRRRRFKIRSRAYLESRTAFLEVKTRGARSATVKDRIGYRLSDRRILTDEARGYAADSLDAIGIDAARADELRMRLTTLYRRATFVAPDGSARSTVDTDLEWRDVSGRTIAIPGMVIIETKSGSAASAFDRALWRAGHRPVRISKYGTGLAALHPELPRNRWARVLRDSFAGATVLAEAPQRTPVVPSPEGLPTPTFPPTPTEETPCAHAI